MCERCLPCHELLLVGGWLPGLVVFIVASWHELFVSAIFRLDWLDFLHVCSTQQECSLIHADPD
jgi:hypothetical protein